MKSEYTIENLYAAALALNIPNEFLSVHPTSSDGLIVIQSTTGAKWDAKLSKNGKIQVWTLRKAW